VAAASAGSAIRMRVEGAQVGSSAIIRVHAAWVECEANTPASAIL
jgi:hypothetical protein